MASTPVCDGVLTPQRFGQSTSISDSFPIGAGCHGRPARAPAMGRSSGRARRPPHQGHAATPAPPGPRGNGRRSSAPGTPRNDQGLPRREGILQDLVRGLRFPVPSAAADPFGLRRGAPPPRAEQADRGGPGPSHLRRVDRPLPPGDAARYGIATGAALSTQSWYSPSSSHWQAVSAARSTSGPAVSRYLPSAT